MRVNLDEQLQWMKPTAASDYELECVKVLKPGDFEIYSEKINLILAEAMEVFVRAGRTSLLIAGDVMTAAYNRQGDLVAANCGTYLHAIIESCLIKHIMKYYRENPGVKEGDIWWANDVLYGGIHNPDQVVAMPVFYEGELIGWTGAAVHTTETGATEPGGMPVTAKSRHDEGLKAPPIKIGENFVLREDILEMLENYWMRAPVPCMVDLRARVTAADRARVRIVELAKKKGPDFITGLFRKMLIVAEEGARKRISSWNDGTFRAVAFADSIGKMPKIHLVRNCFVTVLKEGDHLSFDFTGTSPENDGSYNAYPPAAIGHMSNFIYGYIFRDLPISLGTFAPIDFYFPKGICLNPAPDAATSNSVMICTGVMSAMPNIFAKMMFSSEERVQVTASPGNTGTGLVVAGVNQWGMPFADMLAFNLNTEGQGGRFDMDGVDAFGFPWCPFGRAPDVELVENELPLLHALSQYWPDSCGHGKHRGGVGPVQVWLAHHVPMVFYMSICKNSKIHTVQPLFGGYAPSVIPGIEVRDNDLLEKFGRGEMDINCDLRDLLTRRPVNGKYNFSFHMRQTQIYNKGDIITVAISSGGAGYGDCLERDPQLVMEDLKNKVITDWSATNIYRVAYDPGALEVDLAKTEELRNRAREERKVKGRSYQDFMTDWSQKKPPEEILEYFGSWPDGKLVRPIFRL